MGVGRTLVNTRKHWCKQEFTARTSFLIRSTVFASFGLQAMNEAMTPAVLLLLHENNLVMYSPRTLPSSISSFNKEHWRVFKTIISAFILSVIVSLQSLKLKSSRQHVQFSRNFSPLFFKLALPCQLISAPYPFCPSSFSEIFSEAFLRCEGWNRQIVL